MKTEGQQEINETNQGRDFLEVLKSAPKYDQKWRIDAMQEGDYINMSGKEFKRWSSSTPTDQEALKKLEEIGEVKVVIKKIEGGSLLLKAEGTEVQKRVDASLFYNYGGIPYEDKIVFSRGFDGFDNQDHGDYNVG